jgi:hypothetical protein
MQPHGTIGAQEDWRWAEAEKKRALSGARAF